jgi:hypothetical protein
MFFANLATIQYFTVIKCLVFILDKVCLSTLPVMKFIHKLVCRQVVIHSVDIRHDKNPSVQQNVPSHIQLSFEGRDWESYFHE